MAWFGLKKDPPQQIERSFQQNPNQLPSIQQGEAPPIDTIKYLTSVNIPDKVKKRLEESAWFVDLTTLGLSSIDSKEAREILLDELKNELDLRETNAIQVDLPPKYMAQIQREEDHRGLLLLAKYKADQSINHVMLDKVTSATSTIETKTSGDQGLRDKANGFLFG
jgi:hypothetical protein